DGGELQQDGLLDEQPHELLGLRGLEQAAAGGQIREREIGLLQQGAVVGVGHGGSCRTGVAGLDPGAAAHRSWKETSLSTCRRPFGALRSSGQLSSSSVCGRVARSTAVLWGSPNCFSTRPRRCCCFCTVVLRARIAPASLSRRSVTAG